MKSLKMINKDIDFQLVEDVDELKQRVRLRLETDLDEWFLNDEFGMDYSAIRTKGADDEDIRIAVLEALEQEEGFQDLVEFDIDRQADRFAKITFVALFDGEQISEVIDIE